MNIAMKSLVLTALLAALGGCVYGPGYSYVRDDGYNGDAYYGDEDAYGPAPLPYGYGGWDDGYYGYGYGAAFGLGLYYNDFGRYGHYGDWHHHGWNGHGGWGGHGPAGPAGHSGHAMGRAPAGGSYHGHH